MREYGLVSSNSFYPQKCPKISLKWQSHVRSQKNTACLQVSLMQGDHVLSYLVKICGNKYAPESQKVASYQPNFMGWIFAPRSSRRVKLTEIELQLFDIKKKYPQIRHVAVFAENSSTEIQEVARLGLFDYLQVAAGADWLKEMQIKLSKSEKGLEKTCQILPAIRVQRALNANDLLAYGPKPLFILDSFVVGQPGGTGKRLDLKLIAAMGQPYLLAGGLDPENVREALLGCRACGADISSGIEKGRPGYKDENKLKLFMERVRKLKPHLNVIRASL